jgi:hypothetical protein
MAQAQVSGQIYQIFSRGEFRMAQLNTTVSLGPGARVKLTNVAQVGATGTGTLAFTVPPRPGRGEFSLILQIVGAGITGLTSQLQADFSSGGLGTNLANYGGTGPTAAGVTVFPASGTAPIVAGGFYALNITAHTAGPFDVWAILN